MKNHGLISNVKLNRQVASVLEDAFDQQKINPENDEQSLEYLSGVLKCFFLELSVEQIDLMSKSYSQQFLNQLNNPLAELQKMKEEGDSAEKLPAKKEEGTTDGLQNRKSKKERSSIAD